MNKGFNYLAPALILLAIFVALFPGIRKEVEPSPLEIQSELTDQTRFLAVEEVADAIIRKDPGLCLVDLREADSFSHFSLKTAMNIPFNHLLDSDKLSILTEPGKTVVLFSNGDVVAERAWLLLKRKGIRNLFVMQGGLNQWYRSFFQPVEPKAQASAADFDLYHYRLAVGQYFSGASPMPVLKPVTKSAPEKVELKPVQKAAAEGGC